MTFPSDRILPFSALVGQDSLKLALTMVAVNPRLAGVLIRGGRGTAKSTAARALARLLPPLRVREGCHFSCPLDRPEVACDACREAGEAGATRERPAPFETLPLGITEDRLLGTVDLEHALKHGEQRFAPGLLARVNQGVLYVDEVNLLEDHIVDLLLDAAAMGVNVVAREGVTVSHPAEFALVGTMNPEEGQLRPQLLDRFGLCVEVRALDDPAARARVVERRLAFEADPSGFREAWRQAEEALTQRIARARELLPRVTVESGTLLRVAEAALALGVEGHRGDELVVKGAMTVAALDGRTHLEPSDLERAAELALPHRMPGFAADLPDATDEELRQRIGQVFDARKKKARS